VKKRPRKFYKAVHPNPKPLFDSPEYQEFRTAANAFKEKYGKKKEASKNGDRPR
jgi:hypothetical protein